MFDVLLCYGFTANMIHAGYFGLVGDLFRQVWTSCRWLGAMVAATAPRPSRYGAAQFRRAGEIKLRRLETYVASMT